MEAEDEMKVYAQARDLVHHTVRDWYPGDLIVARPEPINHGTACARVFAWSQITTGLATNLNDLGAMVDGNYSYAHVIARARQLIQSATASLWPAAHLIPLPLHSHLGEAEEFEIYRIGATTLAARLANLSERCFERAFSSPTDPGGRLPPPDER